MNLCVYGWLLSQTQVMPILLVQLIISICNDRCTGHGKTPCPNYMRGQEGPTTRIYHQATISWTCVLAMPQGFWLRLENKQNHLSILKKSCNLLPIETRGSNVQPPILIHSQQWRSHQWRQAAQPVCRPTVSHTSCGMLGESEPHKCCVL